MSPPYGPSTSGSTWNGCGSNSRAKRTISSTVISCSPCTTQSPTGKSSQYFIGPSTHERRCLPTPPLRRPRTPTVQLARGWRSPPSLPFPRVHDDQRLRGTRERHIQLTEPAPGSLLDDERRLDDDDVVELEALRLRRREDVGVLQHLRLDERAGADDREEAVLERGRLARCDFEALLLGDAHELRRRAALPVRERGLDVGRDAVEERQRELHDLGGDAIGVPELLDPHLDVLGE